MTAKLWRTCPQKMKPNRQVLQPVEILFIFGKRHQTALMVWYEVKWYGMVWYVTWYWYGAHIPLWNGVPSRYPKMGDWTEEGEEGKKTGAKGKKKYLFYFWSALSLWAHSPLTVERHGLIISMKTMLSMPRALLLIFSHVYFNFFYFEKIYN